MTDWKKQIGPCFGAVDKLFAIHPSDEKAAMCLLETVRDEGVSWEEFEAAVIDYLSAKKCGQQHVDEQMVRVREMFRPWLRD